MKRSNFITLFLISALLTSCGNVENSDVTTDESVTNEPTETEISDDLPDVNMKQYEFKFLNFGDYIPSYVPESENGDIVNDAIYRRNRTVEERFNVVISSLDTGAVTHGEHLSEVQKLMLAGDECFDVILASGKQLAGQSLSGWYMNLYDLEYLDFNKPWWSKPLVEDLTYNGCMYVCSSNLHYTEFAASKVYYFNKELLTRFQMEDPYSLVFDGRWTFDKMSEMTKDIYEDLNGNSKADNEDLYGMLTTYTHNTWAVAFDIPVWEKTGDGIELVANSQKMVDAFDMVYDWFFESTGVKSETGAEHNTMKQMFMDGKGLFVFGTIADAATNYRESDVEYGIVPFPKYDEAQENYRLFFQTNGPFMFAVPKFASNPERTGIILEALSAEGYKQVIPIYYEKALKAKYLQDEESTKILDLITENRTISFSYLHDNFNEACLGFGIAFNNGYENFSTFYASMESQVRARIALVEKAFS